MRVVAFWAGIAGLAVVAAQICVLVLGLMGQGSGALAQGAGQVAGWGMPAFVVLVAIFLLIVAVTDRRD